MYLSEVLGGASCLRFAFIEIETDSLGGFSFAKLVVLIICFLVPSNESY